MALPQPLPSAKRFEGKYCLVTGASKGAPSVLLITRCSFPSAGIGMGIAIRLAQEGGHVCIHYGRDKAGAESCASIIQQQLADEGITECRTLILGADMGKEEEVSAMFEQLFAAWPR